MRKLFTSILVFISLLALPISAGAINYAKDLIVTGTSAIWTDARAFSTVNDAVSAIGVGNQILLITEAEVCTNLTIPSNINLQFTRGGSITNSGTLTINSPFEAGLFQIFTGAGTVSFGTGAVRVAYPEWWGVDGVSDETEINSAFNAFTASGGTVHLTNPAYSIDGSIVPTVNSVLKLDPYTTITLDNAVNLDMIAIAAANVTITGGILDGNKINQTTDGKGIAATGTADDLTISNMEIKDTWATGIEIIGTDRTQIVRNNIHGCGYTYSGDPYVPNEIGGIETPGGIRIGIGSGMFKVVDNDIWENWIGIRAGDSALHDGSIKGNSFRNNIRTGIALNTDGATSGVRIKVVDNDFYQNGDDAIWFYSIEDSVISGNTVQSDDVAYVWASGTYSGGYGIEVVLSKSIAITGNTIANTHSAAIRLGGTTYSTVSGNTVHLSGTHGIMVNLQVATESNHNTITGNTVYESWSDGIRIEDSDWNTVSSNMIADNGQDGAAQIGIRLLDADRNTIVGNTVRDTGGADQLSGIGETGSADYNTIASNVLLGHTNDIVILGSNTNTFFNSKDGDGARQGRATIASGTSNITVTGVGGLKTNTHPILLTPDATSLQAIEFVKVGTITAATNRFIITTGDDANASADIVVNWLVLD